MRDSIRICKEREDAVKDAVSRSQEGEPGSEDDDIQYDMEDFLQEHCDEAGFGSDTCLWEPDDEWYPRLNYPSLSCIQCAYAFIAFSAMLTCYGAFDRVHL